MKEYKLLKTCLRYVVPFAFDVDGSAFSELCAFVEGQKEADQEGKVHTVWKKKYVKAHGPESDLYGYVKSEFLFEDKNSSIDKEHLGYSWNHWKNRKNKEDENYVLRLDCPCIFWPNGGRRQTPWRVGN